jgi:hypothetical protein
MPAAGVECVAGDFVLGVSLSGECLVELGLGGWVHLVWDCGLKIILEFSTQMWGTVL